MNSAVTDAPSRGERVGAILAFALITMLYLTSFVVFGMIEDREWSDWLEPLSSAVWLFAFSIVGLLIAFHRSRSPIAWICLGFGFVWALWLVTDSALKYETAYPGSLSRPDLIAALSYPLWVPGVGLIAFLLLLFPDGHLPSPRWRPVAWLLTATQVTLAVTGLFLPGVIQETNQVNPLGIEAFAGFRDGWQGIALVMTLVICLLASAISLLVRFRRAEGIERLQLKWLMAAGVVSAVAYAFIFIGDFGIQLVWTVMPIAIGLSMHRHRLYDIDRLISRTAVYTLVIGSLALVYFAGLYLLGELLPLEGDVAVAGSTLAVAFLFNPLRRRVQDSVDRRFNRSRYDSRRVLEEFDRAMQNRVDPEGVVEGWVAVTSETLQPTVVAVWVRGTDG